MGRAIDTLHVVIVRRMLVLVPDNKPDRCTSCFSFVNTGKKLYFVVLLTWSRDFGLSRFATVQFTLDKFRIQFDAGGASVYYTSDPGTMRFSERGQSVYVSDSIHPLLN